MEKENKLPKEIRLKEESIISIILRTAKRYVLHELVD